MNELAEHARLVVPSKCCKPSPLHSWHFLREQIPYCTASSRKMCRAREKNVTPLTCVLGRMFKGCVLVGVVSSSRKMCSRGCVLVGSVGDVFSRALFIFLEQHVQRVCRGCLLSVLVEDTSPTEDVQSSSRTCAEPRRGARRGGCAGLEKRM